MGIVQKGKSLWPLSWGGDHTKVTLKSVRPCLYLPISLGPSTHRSMQNCPSVRKNSLHPKDVGWSEQGPGHLRPWQREEGGAPAWTGVTVKSVNIME